MVEDWAGCAAVWVTVVDEDMMAMVIAALTGVAASMMWWHR